MRPAMRTKLSVGDTLSEVFAIYREQAGVLLPLAFWLYLAVAIVSGLSEGKFNFVYFLSVVLGFVVGMLYQGMVVSLVRDVQDGRRDSSVGDLYRQVTPVLGTLIIASILYGIATGIGFILLIVPGCILLTIWAVLAPAIVVEKRGVIEAGKRSRELVRDNGWPVFGTVIVAAIITALVSIVLLAIAGAIADGPILRIVFGALASTVTAPIGALVAGVLYYRLLAIRGDANAVAGPVSGDELGAPYTPPEPPPPSAGPGATA